METLGVAQMRQKQRDRAVRRFNEMLNGSRSIAPNARSPLGSMSSNMAAKPSALRRWPLFIQESHLRREDLLEGSF